MSRKISLEQVKQTLRDYRDEAYIDSEDYNKIDLILDELNQIQEENEVRYLELVCNNDDCQRKMLIEADKDWAPLDIGDWSMTCPYCGKAHMYVDWKLKAKIEQAIDVRTCGSPFKLEPIGAINYVESDEYIGLETE